MEKRDLGAVAKGFCDKGRRAFEAEFADGSVAGTEQVDTQDTEPVHHGVGVQMSAGESAGEEPRGVASGPVRRFGREARCSRRSEANGSGTLVGCWPSLMLVPVSLSSMTVVGSVTTLTNGWAYSSRSIPATRWGSDSLLPVRSSWIQASRWSWLSDGLVLADRCWTLTVVLTRDFFATTKPREAVAGRHQVRPDAPNRCCVPAGQPRSTQQ